MSRAIALLSDLGAIYAAQVRARIWETAPRARLIDLSHDLPPHGIVEASFVLRAAGRLLPPGTIHLAVVDPGVGGERAPVAVSCSDGSALVGPNNGLLTPLAESLGVRSVIRLDPKRVVGARGVHPTFEGRDLFAPAAALLSLGRSVSSLGPPATLASNPIPEPKRTGRSIAGEIVHVDRFGNLITNVPNDWLGPGSSWTVRLRGSVRRLQRVHTYEALPERAFGLVGSSFGTIEVSRRGTPAAGPTRGRAGDRLRFSPVFPKGSPRRKRRK